MKDVIIPLGLLLFIGFFIYAIIHTAREQRKRKSSLFNLVASAASVSSAGKIVGEGVLNQMAGLAGKLSFRPEIEVRGKRIVAYLADRNATVDDVETLQALFELARSAANLQDEADTR